MTLFFFLVSLCWPSTHLIGTLVTIRYSIKSLPDTRGTSKCGFYKYCLILLKASLHSSFQVLGYFFLNSWKIGSHVVVSWVMNRAIYFNLPKNPLTLFIFFYLRRRDRLNDFLFISIHLYPYVTYHESH
jgi:hypothetical protein